jgi:hypothetical protein
LQQIYSCHGGSKRSFVNYISKARIILNVMDDPEFPMSLLPYYIKIQYVIYQLEFLNCIGSGSSKAKLYTNRK